MRKTIILYGLSLALLVLVLKVLEYRYFIRDLSLEIYVGLIAVFFAALGAWVGLRLTGKKKIVASFPQGYFKLNEDILKQTGISKREIEVLELMSKGNSNQEIADKLFVSLNTVKTHSANLFIKLDVKRRTQAIQRAKELQLIP
jgi:two-component system, NarL family, response regulator LiaR